MIRSNSTNYSNLHWATLFSVFDYTTPFNPKSPTLFKILAILTYCSGFWWRVEMATVIWEKSARLMPSFDILQDLHGEDLKETVQECYELSAEYESKHDSWRNLAVC
ncbi:Phosphoenolpyruvate carboxylase 1 [Datura stramonium]|uniref:Phosphoenolpyruvate carboxylase 1 n=1 Tax=Datura stramonium TaxID=4076 RepID=A0ABS8WGH5_DATST|nr:Phosphoenolpyruvate carboxylase 1 [Datura stramonium]